MKKLIITTAFLVVLSGSTYSQWSVSGNNIYNSNSGIVGIGGGASGAGLHYGSKGILAKFSGSDRTLFELHSPDGANQVIFQSLSDAFYLTSQQGKPLFLQGAGRVALGDFPGNVYPPLMPSYKLDIQVNAPDDGININQWGNGACGVHLNNSNGQRFSLMSTTSGHFSLNQKVGATSTERLFINGTTGNVGIGTSNANWRLDIVTSSLNDGLFITQTTDGASAVHLNNLTAGGRHWGMFSTGATNNQGAGNFSIYQYDVWADRLFIRGSDGNVGINSNTPNSKLTVAGDLRIDCPTLADALVISDGTNVNFKVKKTGIVYAREINVQLTAFPDYVFASNYKLMPLEDLETFIEKNKHLPNIPPASVVEDEGGNLGELARLQMEKIEELTLYIIQLKKEIEDLKKRDNKH
jgi:hypothetical protein